MILSLTPFFIANIACMAGIKVAGKGKKTSAKRSLLLSSQFSRGRFDPFPRLLRPATQREQEKIIDTGWEN